MATATRSSHRYRVAPRNGRSGGGSRIRWDRLGRVVLVVVIFVVLASYVSPTLNVFDTWRDSKARGGCAQVQRRAHSRRIDSVTVKP